MIETFLYIFGVLLGTALGYAIKAARDKHTQIQIGESETASVQIQVYVAKPVDEFVCSKCGIILEDWSRVEIDEDDGEITNHEYVFRFCPNCGAKMGGANRGTD